MMLNFLRKEFPRLASSCVVLGMLTAPCHGETDPMFRRYFEKLQGLIKEEVITEGSFRELNIGQDKSSAAISLRKMGIASVSTETRNVVTITHASGLNELKNAESVRIDGSSDMILVLFSGDRIEKIKASPHYKWSERTKELKTRDEVFALFSEILNSDPRAFVRNFGFVPGWATLDPISDSDRLKLDKYNLWTANFKNDDGYWHLKLGFDDDVLEEIIVLYSPVELP